MQTNIHQVSTSKCQPITTLTEGTYAHKFLFRAPREARTSVKTMIKQQGPRLRWLACLKGDKRGIIISSKKAQRVYGTKYSSFLRSFMVPNSSWSDGRLTNGQGFCQRYEIKSRCSIRTMFYEEIDLSVKSGLITKKREIKLKEITDRRIMITSDQDQVDMLACLTDLASLLSNTLTSSLHIEVVRFWQGGPQFDEETGTFIWTPTPKDIRSQRMYSERGHYNLAMVSRKMRKALLAGTGFSDVDQVASHATIMFNKFLMVGMDDAANNVEELIHLRNTPEGTSSNLKNRLNSSIYGHKDEPWNVDQFTDMLNKFQKDCREFEKRFCDEFKDETCPLFYHNARTERQLQIRFEQLMSKMGYKLIEHIFDGCILDREPTREHLQMASVVIESETGFKMKWTVKENF